MYMYVQEKNLYLLELPLPETVANKQRFTEIPYP